MQNRGTRYLARHKPQIPLCVDGKYTLFCWLPKCAAMVAEMAPERDLWRW